MHKIKENLKRFYNKNAEQFHNTRKKLWPEFNYILAEINKSENNNIKILELWCGDWRLLKFLQENSNKNINYKWIDLSNKLIDIAKVDNPGWNFVVNDMINQCEIETQEEYDFVISVASFQHLPNSYQRILLLKHIYKCL